MARKGWKPPKKLGRYSSQRRARAAALRNLEKARRLRHRNRNTEVKNGSQARETHH